MENSTPEPSPENLPATPEPPCPPAAETSAEPEPAQPTEQPQGDQASKPEEPADPLLALAHAAKAARLSPGDEDRAVTLLKERLAKGRAGITAAVAAMTDGLPWVVAVNAVSAAWEQLSLVMRRHLLSSLAKTETETARRLRLSLARGIFKIDPPAGLKLAAAAAAGLKDPETGTLSSKHRQYFFNVLIGKGKPWLLQLPLGDLKAADAEALSHAAIESLSFCPPFSQLSILRWIHGAGRLKKIGEGDLALLTKSVARWNVKFQRQLKAEIDDLPAELEAVLKPEALKPAPAAEAPAEKPAPEPSGEAAEPAEAAEHGEQHEPSAEATPGEAPAREEDEEEAAEGRESAQPGRPERSEGRRERLSSKEQRRREKEEQRRKHEEERRKPEEIRRAEPRNRPFDPKDALRGIESYIASLRSELESAKAQLNRQEKQRPLRIQRPEEALPTEEVEAIKRHNARLESTVSQLQAELEALAANHEAIAESRLLHTGEPLPEDNVAALRSLLAIKLQEAFETYQAMRLEPLDKVFRLDYRDLLGSVFDVLMDQGVPLKK